MSIKKILERWALNGSKDRWAYLFQIGILNFTFQKRTNICKKLRSQIFSQLLIIMIVISTTLQHLPILQAEALNPLPLHLYLFKLRFKIVCWKRPICMFSHKIKMLVNLQYWRKQNLMEFIVVGVKILSIYPLSRICVACLMKGNLLHERKLSIPVYNFETNYYSCRNFLYSRLEWCI